MCARVRTNDFLRSVYTYMHIAGWTKKSLQSTFSNSSVFMCAHVCAHTCMFIYIYTHNIHINIIAGWNRGVATDQPPFTLLAVLAAHR